MSHDDAATNSARAEEIRRFVALHIEGTTNTRQVAKITGYTDDSPEEQTAILSVDLLLCAADALEAQGVKGWAAARLAAAEHCGDEMIGDVILEAADTFDDSLAEFRRTQGNDRVDDALDELREQD